MYLLKIILISLVFVSTTLSANEILNSPNRKSVNYGTTLLGKMNQDDDYVRGLISGNSTLLGLAKRMSWLNVNISNESASANSSTNQKSRHYEINLSKEFGAKTIVAASYEDNKINSTINNKSIIQSKTGVGAIYNLKSDWFFGLELSRLNSDYTSFSVKESKTETVRAMLGYKKESFGGELSISNFKETDTYDDYTNEASNQRLNVQVQESFKNFDLTGKISSLIFENNSDMFWMELGAITYFYENFLFELNTSVGSFEKNSVFYSSKYKAGFGYQTESSLYELQYISYESGNDNNGVLFNLNYGL